MLWGTLARELVISVSTQDDSANGKYVYTFPCEVYMIITINVECDAELIIMYRDNNL